MSIKKPKVFWPVVLTSANNSIIINDGGTSWTMTVAAGTYFGAADLAAAIQTAIAGHFGSSTVTVSATGHFVFTWTAGFTLKCATTPSLQCFTILGFTAVDVPSVANAVTCANQHQNGWYAPVAVSNDSIPIRNRDMDTVTRSMAGQTKFITETELAERAISLMWLPPEKTLISYATGVNINQALEQWWQDGRARFRYWEDATADLSFADYVLSQKTIANWTAQRQLTRKALYKMDLTFWGYVA